MHTAESIPLRRQDVVVFTLCPNWGAWLISKAVPYHCAHYVKKEVRAIVHYLQSEEYCQIPELNITNRERQNRAILHTNNKEWYLQKQPSTKPHNPINKLNSIPNQKHKQWKEIIIKFINIIKTFINIR